MASNRHLARIIALQTLFELDFRTSAGDQSFDVEHALKRNADRYKTTLPDTSFLESLVRGVAKHTAEIDDELQRVASKWPINEIARMDRVILRMGVFELTRSDQAPPKVAINEAVELAKAFGNENSSRFVNGALGTYWRQVGGEDGSDSDVSKSAKADSDSAKKGAV